LQQIDPPEVLERQCQVVIRHLIARYHWQLLSPDEFVQRTIQQVRAGMSEDLTGIAISVYCAALHAACSGAEGVSRQNQAYAELTKYLYSLTCQRFWDVPPDIREDVTQSALEHIYRSFSHCREPSAFLAFAAYQLLDAVKKARRQENQPIESLNTNDEIQQDIVDGDQLEISAQVIVNERPAAIEHFLQAFLQAHPSASQQVTVLRLIWLHKLDNTAIAQQLGISLNSVYVARSRIIKTIQSEPKWRALASDLGILGSVPEYP